MHNSCGNAVHVSGITYQIQQQLYPCLRGLLRTRGYKTHSYTLVRTHLSTMLTHSNFSRITTVMNLVIPTIHTTYKEQQNYLTKNILLIYPGAVYK